MAKAKANETGAALAKSGSGEVRMAETLEMPGDWLSDVLGGEVLDITGTEEMDSSDVRLPTWLLNSKKEDKESGRQAPDDTFWNTVTEKTKDRLRLVVLTNHKSRIWREEDSSSKELVVRCSSWDGVTGRMQDDSTRPCKGCPDYQWTTGPDGKRGRNCTDVNNLISLDRETRDVCVVKVKTTAIKGFRQYYQEHFYKKRQARVGGKIIIADIPFFAAETIVEAEKRTGGGYTWYVPRFEFGGALPKEEILGAAEMVKSFLPELLDRAAQTADVDATPDTEVVETTGTVVDPNDFRDDGPSADASSGGAKRF